MAAVVLATSPSTPLDAAEPRTDSRKVRIFLHDADVISGELLRIDNDILHIETRFGGALAIPADAVERVEYQDPLQAELAPVGDDSEDEDFVPAIVEDERFFPFEAEGRIELGLDFISGTRDRRELKVDTDTRLDFGENRLNLEAKIDRRQAGSRTFVDRKQFEVVYDRFLGERVYVSPLLRWRQNRVAGLDHRWTSALRLGYVVFDEKARMLEILGGPLWQRERTRHAGRENTWAATWTVDYRQQLSRLSDRLSLFHEQDVSIDIDAEPGRSIVTADSGMRYKVSGNLFLAAVVEYDVDTERNFKVDTWERTIGLNVGYQW